MSYSKIVILGRLGKDVEFKNVKDTSVANFSVATSKKVKDKEYTSWHNIVAWGKTAEICSKYLKKGSQVLIEGEMTYRDWEDKNKVKRTQAEIVASNVQFIGGKPQGQQREEQQQVSSEFGNPDDQIPF